MPAAAVIPAPIAYIKVVAFKTLVVEVCSWVWYFIAVCLSCWLWCVTERCVCVLAAR